MQMLTADTMTTALIAPVGAGKSHTVGEFARLWTTFTGRRGHRAVHVYERGPGPAAGTGRRGRRTGRVVQHRGVPIAAWPRIGCCLATDRAAAGDGNRLPPANCDHFVAIRTYRRFRAVLSLPGSRLPRVQNFPFWTVAGTRVVPRQDGRVWSRHDRRWVGPGVLAPRTLHGPLRRRAAAPHRRGAAVRRPSGQEDDLVAPGAQQLQVAAGRRAGRPYHLLAAAAAG